MTKAKPVYLSLDGREFLKLRADPDDVRRLFESLQQGDADEEAVKRFFNDAAGDDGSVTSASPSPVSRRLTTKLQAEGVPAELGAPEEAVEISSKTFEAAIANGDFVDPAVDEAPGDAPAAEHRLKTQAPDPLSRKSSPSNRVSLSMKSHAWVRSGRSTSPFVADSKEDTGGKALETKSADEQPVAKDEDEKSVRTFHESAIEVVDRKGATSIGFYRRGKGEAEATVETSSPTPNAAEENSAEKSEGNVGIEAVHPHEGKPLLVEAHRPASGYMRMEAEDDEEKDVEPGIETVEEEGRTVIGVFARRGEPLEEELCEEEEAGNISLTVDGEEVQTLSLGTKAMAMLVSCAACHACAGGTEGGAEPESGDPSDVEEEASAESGGQKEPELVSEELKLDEPAASEPEALASEESEASPPQWIDPLRKKSIMCVSESLSEREDLSERKDPVEDEMEGKEDKRDDDNEINPSQQATQKKTAIEEEETEDCSHDGSQEMTLEETMEETQPKKTGSKRMGGARKRLGRYWRSAVGVSTNKRQ
ncbi:hypothetical protein ACHAXT_004142 [Thalassiosira profunda]